MKKGVTVNISAEPEGTWMMLMVKLNKKEPYPIASVSLCLWQKKKNQKAFMRMIRKHIERDVLVRGDLKRT